MPVVAFVVIGAFFGLLAAAMAFLITYRAYAKHRLAPARVLRESLISGSAAFAVFFVGSLAGGYVLWGRAAH